MFVFSFSLPCVKYEGLLYICWPNVEVTWPALGLSDREPRRYVLPFLYEKIITYQRNGKTCNELRAKYGCAFSEALRSKPEENSQPFERYSCVARIRKRIADWSELSMRRRRDHVDRMLCRFFLFNYYVEHQFSTIHNC